MLSEKQKQELKNRYERVRQNIEEAAQKANREPDDIKLIVVGKKQPLKKIMYVSNLGVHACAESRVQELREKEEQATERINWHFVGHLQRNKVKYLARMDDCSLIHSLDSERLAREIDKRAAKNNRILSALVQVNVAKDENKFGLMPEELLSYLEVVEKFDNINIEGLMTLVPYFEDCEETRPFFKKLFELRQKALDRGFDLPELSMGMTNDYEVAIEEGATMIRLGREIFGPRNY